LEDKQLILNMLLYTSDHSTAAKPTMIYFKWMVDMME